MNMLHNIARKFIEFDKQIRNIWYEYIYLEEVISNTPLSIFPKEKLLVRQGELLTVKELEH
jgi:hypothetical protein